MPTPRTPPAPRVARSRWTLALLRQHCKPLQGLRSTSGVWRRLAKWGIRRKRGRHYIHSPDPAYAGKLCLIQRALHLQAQQPEQVVVLYGDEHTFYRQPLLGATYAEQGSGGQCQPRAVRAHAKNTKRRTVATLDVGDGRTLHASASKMGVKGLCRFFAMVREHYGPDVRLLLIWDNWPVHYHEAVLLAAAQYGIELLWLPTYAPWLNPIEKLWRKLVEEVLCLHRLSAAWEQLQEEVQRFLSSYNRPAPDLLRYVGLLTD